MSERQWYVVQFRIEPGLWGTIKADLGPDLEVVEKMLSAMRDRGPGTIFSNEDLVGLIGYNLSEVGRLCSKARRLGLIDDER